MTSEVLSLIALASTFILGVLQWRASVQAQASKGKAEGAQAYDITTDTMMKLSKRIDELEIRDAQKEKRIEELEEQVRKWKRAYNRAINHIRLIAPNQDVPDFLQDTGDLVKK